MNIGKEEGITIPSTGHRYTDPEVTAAKLREYRDNVYGAGLSNKQNNLLFVEEFTVEILDPKGETDTELQTEFWQMLKNAKVWPSMMQTYNDLFWFGAAFFNPVESYKGNLFSLKEMRHLPAYTFDTPPPGKANLYADILQGVYPGTDGMEYWQTVEYKSTLLKNIVMFKDPREEGIAGRPYVLPLVPVFNMLTFAWNAQMQRVNRVGAPLLGMTVVNPKKASDINGNVSDNDYTRMFLENWGKDSAYVFRESMIPTDLKVHESDVADEIIDSLHKITMDYMNPGAFISKQGTLIGGSTLPEQDMVMRYVNGVHTMMENQYNSFLQRYLDLNGYEDYTIGIHVPRPSSTHVDLDIQKAREGFNTQSLHPNEIRQLLGLETLDDEELSKIKDFYAAAAPGNAAAAFLQALKTDTRDEKPPQEEKKTENKLKNALDILTADILAALDNES